MTLNSGQHDGNNEEDSTDDIIYLTHPRVVYPGSKSEASVTVGLLSIIEAKHKGYNYEDNCPNSRAGAKRVKLPVEHLPLSPLVEAVEAQSEHGHIDDEGYVHMNVDHGTDDSTHPRGQVPAVSGIVVDAKRDGGQE